MFVLQLVRGQTLICLYYIVVQSHESNCSEYFVYAIKLFYFIQPHAELNPAAVKLAHRGGGGLHTYHWEIIMAAIVTLLAIVCGLLFYLT